MLPVIEKQTIKTKGSFVNKCIVTRICTKLHALRLETTYQTPHDRHSHMYVLLSENKMHIQHTQAQVNLIVTPMGNFYQIRLTSSCREPKGAVYIKAHEDATLMQFFCFWDPHELPQTLPQCLWLSLCCHNM